VIRIQGVEEPVVSLIGLTRPYPALKGLDMDDVCEQILTALGEE
jgi:hypothetical protein